MRTFPLLAFMLLTTACAGSRAALRTTEPATTIVRASELEWEQLNPARGDQSPKAAALWGDRKDLGPSGFLVRFVDGFSSPPHIHNVSYRAVVIDGLIHNDDPRAGPMWMPRGSFWTQPKGAPHITAATGNDAMAYIEIDEGPYLVRPVEEAFQSEERSVNEDASHVAWVSASGATESGLLEAAAEGTEIALLWEQEREGGSRGILVKLRAGSSCVMRNPQSPFRIVVIQGGLAQHAGGGTDPVIMGPGSYIGSNGAAAHVVCDSARDCILYVRIEN